MAEFLAWCTWPHVALVLGGMVGYVLNAGLTFRVRGGKRFASDAALALIPVIGWAAGVIFGLGLNEACEEWEEPSFAAVVWPLFWLTLLAGLSLRLIVLRPVRSLFRLAAGDL